MFLLYRQTRNTNNYQPWCHKEVAQQRSYKGEGNLKCRPPRWLREPAWLPSLRACREHITTWYACSSSAQQAQAPSHLGLYGRWEMFLVGFSLLVFLELWNLKRMEKGKSRVMCIQYQRLWEVWREAPAGE